LQPITFILAFYQNLTTQSYNFLSSILLLAPVSYAAGLG